MGDIDEEKGIMNGKDEHAQTKAENKVPSPPIPPDGGYGWVIAVASFFISFFVDGVCYSYGIFMIDLVDFFKTSRAKAAIVGSVLTGVYQLFGLFASGLINKFGARPVTIVGAFVSLAAFSLSILSPNIETLIFSFGFMGGIGFSLMYLPSVVIVGFYFEKKRALATGVAMCGTGAGSFAFAILGNVLLLEYGWKGAVLIVGGIAFNSAIMGAAFRPLPPGPDIIVTEAPEVKDDAGNEQMTVQIKYSNKNDEAVNFLSIPSELNKMNKVRPRQISHLRSNPSVVYQSCEDVLFNSVRSLKGRPKHMRLEMAKPLHRQDVFYVGSIQKLPQYQSRNDVTSYIRSITEIPIYDDDLEEKKTGLKHKLRSCYYGSIGFLDFSLLKSLTVVIYAASCFLFNFGFIVVLMFIADAAEQVGVEPHNAALALSLTGITNTIGRLLCGWVSDHEWADVLLINSVALTLGGLMTYAVPFCLDFGSIAAYCTIFGFSMAVFNVQRTMIIVDLMGLESLSSTFGIVQLAQGLSVVCSGPIAGAIFDATGNYDLSFYLAATSMVLAGLICFPLRRISAWENRTASE